MHLVVHIYSPPFTADTDPGLPAQLLGDGAEVEWGSEPMGLRAREPIGRAVSKPLSIRASPIFPHLAGMAAFNNASGTAGTLHSVRVG